jgi:hypothetical protein
MDVDTVAYCQVMGKELVDMHDEAKKKKLR